MVKEKKFITDEAYQRRLHRFFQGEVFGEAAYAMAARCTWRIDRKHKLETLRRLETQTKTQLRVIMLQRGMSVNQRKQYQLLGNAVGTLAAILPWRLTLKFLELIICNGLKSLERFLCKAPLEEKIFAKSVMAHEYAQYEFVQRELHGDENCSLEQVLALLET